MNPQLFMIEFSEIAHLVAAFLYAPGIFRVFDYKLKLSTWKPRELFVYPSWYHPSYNDLEWYQKFALALLKQGSLEPALIIDDRAMLGHARAGGNKFEAEWTYFILEHILCYTCHNDSG